MSPTTERPLDKVLNDYSQFAGHPTSKLLHFITIPVLTFGLLGLIWVIPFPYLSLLGKYNGFVNWASFVIALSIYYYYRLSPMLSYGALLLVFAFSGGVVSLEKLSKARQIPALGTVFLGIFILGLALQYLAYSAQKKYPSPGMSAKGLLVGPLWLIAQILQKAGLKI